MRRLKWFAIGEGAPRSAVVRLESALGCTFPADFVDFAMKYAGSSNPDESEFTVSGKNSRQRIGNFGAVLRIDGDDVDSVLAATANLGSQLPSGIVPVVGTGSGDYVCLDYRIAGLVTVSYFAHEKSGDDSLIPLARTFTDFIEMLREPTDN